MVKAIRIKLSQQMANYRKPASFLIRESYPLPPYSSVIGMIHAACGFEKYHPMKVSVQGWYASETSDFATMYNFGIKYDETRHQAKVQNESGGYDGINIGPKNVHVLTDIYLVIHVIPEDENDFEKIVNGMMCPQNYLSLGRYEDLARLEDTVDIVELVEDEDYACKYDIYVPFTTDLKSGGTIYNINKVFQIDTKSKLRNWKEVVKVRHVSKGEMLDIEDCWYDTELETIVCFA